MSLIEIVKKAKLNHPTMAQLSSDKKNEILKSFAQLIINHKDFLIAENKKDLELQRGKISNALYGRLVLDENKIKDIAQGILGLTELDDPCNQTLMKMELDEGLILTQVSASLGVIAVIFESRPDVIPQVLSLILKSGNCCLLKGGKEATHSNQAFMSLVKKLNEIHPEIVTDWANYFQSREEVSELLKLDQYIDLVIPRGSNELVQTIIKNTSIPVLGHADGVCHIFVDNMQDTELSLKVILDAKIQYPTACNAVETVLVHKQIAEQFIPKLAELLKNNNVEIFVDQAMLALLPNCKTVFNWHHEYGDLKISIKIVNDTDEAIQHINQYGSHHTDCILSQNDKNIEKFKSLVDSASVMSNASTRFADGFRYGMGAEVGISTNKTHARGPVGLQGLVIYKYFLDGQGQTVSEYIGPKAKPYSHKILKK